MEKKDLMISPENLRLVFSPDSLTPINSLKPESSVDFIGQERAIESLKFGLEVEKPGYNIFVCGIDGTGRTSIIRNYVEAFVKENKTDAVVNLKDFCFVYNLDDPSYPKLLTFKRGDGTYFKEDVEEILEKLNERIPLVVSGADCINKKEEIVKSRQKELASIYKNFEKDLQTMRFSLSKEKDDETPTLRPFSLKEGEEDILMSPEEFENLDDKTRSEIIGKQWQLVQRLSERNSKISEISEEIRTRSEEADEKAVANELESIFNLSRYKDNIEATGFLEELKVFVLENLDCFKSQAETTSGLLSKEPDIDLIFEVNLFIDNSKTKDVPVIFEDDPTLVNLFGSLEKELASGKFVFASDHTMIRSGSLCRANGGYLILKAHEIFENVGVWEALKKTLRNGSLKIEDPIERFGLIRSSLNPDEIPINVKVLIVGDQYYYHVLSEHDEDFLSLFKVKAEFDSEMNLTKENVDGYTKFITQCCTNEKLLPIDFGAVSRILEQGLRISGSQKKLSTKLRPIKNLLIESDHWARKEKSQTIRSEHVKKAIKEKKQRADYYERKERDLINENIILIDTEGKKIGQINALMVIGHSDELCFGMPGKITAKTFMGKSGVISIQREVDMSGPIHDTGIMILKGYFGQKYGQDKPLTFSSSLCFEQSYFGVDGDSASAAEIIVLTSSISKIPIDQGIAITGSVNQNGEIQPIGGVNEKIEGFFEVCRERELNGKQGVIIPHQNVKDLMLKEEVVEAARQGKFSVYSIKNIDEGMEILMDEPAARIHKAVDNRLKEMAKGNSPSKKIFNLFKKIKKN